MGTDSKTAVQQPSSKIAVVSSSKNSKKKKTKTVHHKSKHSKQQRSDSSSSHSSDDNERTAASSSSKKTQKGKSTKEKSKGSSSNDARYTSKKSSNNKKKSTRSKHDSSESPHRKNNRSTRSQSKSRSDSGRSSDRSSSPESSSRRRSKNSNRRSNSNMPNAYSSTSHSNFSSNMPRRYAQSGNLQNRGGRMMPYLPPGMMGGQGPKNNGLRRPGAGGNSPPQSLMGGYRGHGNGNFRGRGNNAMSNQAYMHNMANMLKLLQQQQQKPGSHKFNNPNNPNNRFYQQFQDNYKKISSGQKVSNLYQASFPVQHIPSEMRFNFRLLGRNIFTASDEEEEKAQQEKAAAASEKRSKRRDSSSDSESNSDRERSNRRGEDDDDDEHDKKLKSKSKSSPGNKGSTEQKRFSGKQNRNRTSSTTATHSKATPKSQDLLNDPSNLSTLLAGIIRADDPETLANTLATAAAAVTNKRERNKQQEKKVQKFKNYARIQQIQASAAGVAPSTNPEDVEKKIHGLARRLQMKTIGLHDDYEQQGIKRSDESSIDSDTGARRHHSSGSSSDRSKDRDGASDGSNNSQVQRKLKNSKRTSRKMNAAGQPIVSSDSEHHRSDGNDSDGSMLNLKEDLKPICYYIKDRERMLKEMFRCVRGHKLQAILPDALKTRSLEEIKSKCLDQLDILSKKRIRAILLAQPMMSSSGTEDSSDEDEQDFLSLYPHLKSSFENHNSNQNNVSETNAAGVNLLSENQKKSLPNSKFRPVQMQAVTETTQPIYNSLSAPVVVGGDEDVNDYYEGFKHLKKLSTLRRNEQEDDFLPFPDQSGKVLQPIGSSVPKFEFKPITSLTHSQQAHLNARRAANRQQQQQKEVHQEIDDLLNIDDFVIPEGERPLSSAELSTNEQRRYGLPPRLHHRPVPGPPKKGSLGDLLKQKGKGTGERSPSPIIDEGRIRRAGRRRHRSRSLSSTGSGKWSRSSSRSNRDDPTSPIFSRETTPTLVDKTNGIDDETDFQNEDLTDMNDLSKLLDLNEEDELLLLQIEVEQEEKNLRRQKKRQRKEEKKNRKKMKKVNSSDDDQIFVHQCVEDLLRRIVRGNDASKRTFDNLDSSMNSDDILKKLKTEESM